MKKRELIIRVPDPFDGSADARLAHMGILTATGEIVPDTLSIMAQIYAGLFMDELDDFYDDWSILSVILGTFGELASKKDYNHMLLLLSLQFDYMRKPLPDPIWWISSRSNAVDMFMDGFSRCFTAMMAQAGSQFTKQEDKK